MPSNNQSTISRRSVAKGVAWSVPVVTLATAAPAMAVSEAPVAPSVGEGSCKHSNEKRYHIELVFTNSLNCSTTVTVTSFTVTPNSGKPVSFSSSTTPTFTLTRRGTAGSSTTLVYDSDEVDAISQGTATVTYTYTDCSGKVVSTTQSINVPNLNPCKFRYPH